MSYFDNSTGAILNQPNFLHVAGNINVHRDDEQPSDHRVLDLLRPNVAHDAFLDAAARKNPPRCHPDTRLSIIDHIKECIQRMSREDRTEFIIWLCGPAGSGKSAIVQTLAEFYAHHHHHASSTLASFFFSRTGTWNNTTSQFVASIAYQLCSLIPDIRRYVEAAVKTDPVIFERNLKTQMQVLIVQPWNQVAQDLRNGNVSKTHVVVVDGLDEASRVSDQTDLIEELAALKGQLLYHIPFVFLIASRPELSIQQAFDTKDVQPHMQKFDLGDKSKYDAAGDIDIFLRAEFTKLKELNPSLNESSGPWPNPEYVNDLVQKSSGQFIYAATVMKYIASPQNNPNQSLQVILGLSNDSTPKNPFAQLDAVYKFILDTTDTNLSRVLDILALIFLQTGYAEYLSIRFIEELLEYNAGDVKAALANMHALVQVPSSEDDTLSLYHASLHHYLTDRSEIDHRLDVQRRHVDLARRLFRFINAAPPGEYKKARFIPLVNGFINHFSKVSMTDDLASDLKAFSLAVFLSDIPLNTFYAAKWDAFFMHLGSECKEENKGLYRRLLSEFDTWIRIRFEKYPPTIRRCMSAACAIPQTYTMNYLPDIFEIITHALPIPEATRIQKLDDDALMFRHMSSMKFSDLETQTILQIFFANRARSRAHFADEAKFVKLAKKIVQLLCRRNENKHSDSETPSTLKIQFGDMVYFEKILTAASRDLKLARLLWNTIVQVTHSPRNVLREGNERMAIASLEYIKRCGIHVPEHTHKAHCDTCANHRPIFLSLSMPLQSAQYIISGEWRGQILAQQVYEPIKKIEGINVPLTPQRNSFPPTTPVIDLPPTMPQPNRQGIFPNSFDVNILGGTFTKRSDGFQILLHNIAPGAFHDAAERGDPPRAFPHTRVAIRAEILEWIRAPGRIRKLILWIYGPAGSGKTAIAQSIAEECQRLGLLAASFFFSRTAAGRNDTSRFVATLAYQLSLYIPLIKDHLFTAIEDDPTIFSRSLSTQMRVLVIEPLKAVPSLPTPIFSIVDGIDECGPDDRSKSELLYLLGSVASELQHIPLIFLIASRPEYEIRKAFNENILSPLTRVLVLDDNYKPDNDIALYFDSTFHDICEEHRRLGSRLPSPWPTPTDVDSLVSKASGQFIFAATVTKFINSPRHNPADRLDVILRLSASGNETPFALLDVLYRFILNSVADVEKVLQILVLVLLVGDYEKPLTLDLAEELLGFKIRSALVDMHPLVSVPSQTDNTLPRIHHASFPDFLMDRSRSLEYYIDISQGHTTLRRLWIKMVQSYRGSQFSEAYSLSNYVDAVVYHCTESRFNNKNPIADDLATFRVKAFFERISQDIDGMHDLYTSNWTAFFNCGRQQGGARENVYLHLLDEFNAFMHERLSLYPQPLQSCIPAIFNFDASRAVDIFTILLRIGSPSASEIEGIIQLDSRFLNLQSLPDGYNSAFPNFFRDKARAAVHHLNSKSYAMLARQIVQVLFPKSEGRQGPVKIEKVDKGTDRLARDASEQNTPIRLVDVDLRYFAEIIQRASSDVDLAIFLRERTLQYSSNNALTPAWNNIAMASLAYIQRCDVPYQQHGHPPDTDKCVICEGYYDVDTR